MNQFDIRKFLTENNLTVASRQTNEIFGLSQKEKDAKFQKWADEQNAERAEKEKQGVGIRNVKYKPGMEPKEEKPEDFWDKGAKVANKMDKFSNKVKDKVKKAFSQKNAPEDDITKAGKFDWKYGVDRDENGKVLDSKVWKRNEDGVMQKVKK